MRERFVGRVHRLVPAAVGAGLTALQRVGLPVAVIGVVFALVPSIAAASVPYSAWYWTLAVPGSNPNVVVLAENGGLYRSTDGGTTWVVTGLKGDDVTSVVKTATGLLAAGVHVTGKNAVLVVNHDYYVSPGTSVLATSSDGGATWQTLQPSGLPRAGVQALAVDPSNGTIVYALLRTGPLYRSTNGGHSFHLVATKVGGTPWAVGITEDGHLVAGNMTNGNYLSANAVTWQSSGFVDPQGGKMIMEYATKPGDPSTLLMTSYGVELSTNGGASWHVVLPTKVMFGPVAWASDTVAYAVGFDQSLWRTDDGGTTWTKVG